MDRKLISFDLDDTLICYGESVPREPNPGPWPVGRWFQEPLRRGTCELMRSLSLEGWSIAVYTTSGRSAGWIRIWLRLYGVRLALVVNQRRHRQALTESGLTNGPTKLPSLFGIGVHVDDSEGVYIEGLRYGFRVVVVRPDDQDWINTVRRGAQEFLDEAARRRGTAA